VLNWKQSRTLALALLVLISATGSGVADASAQPVVASLKTEIYFGSNLGDGTSVSEEAWEAFVADVVVPRFPAGITVLEALGRGRSTVGPLAPTRVLVVVHPDDPDTQARFSEIRAEYRKRFATAGQFHIDQPVRIRD